MKVLVVDDERPARDRLVRLLSTVTGLDLLEPVADGVAALDAIARHRPDAVFLDVQMRGLSGFEVVTALPPDPPRIVFVTAYDRYALQAFDVNAVDYLLKPVSEARLQEALARLRERDANAGLARLLAAMQQGPPLQRVVGKYGNTLHVLPVDTIEAFVSEQELVFAHTATNRFLIDKTLRDLETRLDRTRFARVHKQAIVNVDKVRLLEPTGAGGTSARLNGGHAIPISRRYSQSLRRMLAW